MWTRLTRRVQTSVHQAFYPNLDIMISRAHDHMQATSAGMPSRIKNPTEELLIYQSVIPIGTLNSEIRSHKGI